MTELATRKPTKDLGIIQAKKSLNGHDPIEYIFCAANGPWKCKQPSKKTSYLSSEDDSAEDLKPLAIVEFGFGSAKLSKRAKAYISEKISSIKGHSIVVAGYTDNKGKPSINEVLAEKRAASVKNFLVEQGIPVSKIVTEANPLCCYLTENSTSSTRRMNRRAEIILRSAH